MLIPVLGMDPSLRNWGLAEAELDLDTGYLTVSNLSTVRVDDLKGKQVRQNSNDMHIAEQLSQRALYAGRLAKVVFVECPVGSQSARAMASYGICVGVLGAMRAEGIPLIEVTALEVKMALAGKKDATKREMIDAAVRDYPNANFPRHKGRVADTAEHVADAIGTIHAGVQTPTFQQLIRLLQKV